MHLQYISDNQGHTTAVQLQIPIEDWNELKKKYSEFEAEEKAALVNIPDWQIDFGRAELDNLEKGSGELLNWEESRSRFKI